MRAFVEYLVAELFDFFVEFVHRAHLIDQTHLERLLSCVKPARIDHLTRLPFAHVAGQQLAGAPDRYAADAWADLAELRILACNGHVAKQMDFVTAADTKAAYLSDDRLVDHSHYRRQGKQTTHMRTPDIRLAG